MKDNWTRIERHFGWIYDSPEYTWCKNNLANDNWAISYENGYGPSTQPRGPLPWQGHFLFKNSNDAMLFKLMWA